MYFSLFFSYLSLCSRGLLEILFPKGLAYLLSLGSFAFFILLFFIKTKPKFKPKFISTTLPVLFLTSAATSLFTSLIAGVDVANLLYFIYPLFISAISFFCLSTTIPDLNTNAAYRSIAALAYLLIIVATAQQLNYITLPGSTPLYGLPLEATRPSSLTGSYLHYPLIMTALGFYLISLKGRLDLSSVTCFLSVFVAFSRSGMLIVIISAFLMAFHTIYKSNGYLRKKIVGRFFLTAIFFLALGTVYFEYTVNILERTLSSLQLDGIGNTGRIEAWDHGLDIFTDGNVLFGSNFGLATNLTGNLFFGATSFVVESSLIQNLVNFGLIGTILFYSLLAYAQGLPKIGVQKFFFIAVTAQSFVYQSIEVLPFISLTFLILLFRSNEGSCARRTP